MSYLPLPELKLPAHITPTDNRSQSEGYKYLQLSSVFSANPDFKTRKIYFFKKIREQRACAEANPYRSLQVPAAALQESEEIHADYNAIKPFEALRPH